MTRWPALVLIVIAACVSAACERPAERELLRELYTPSFSTVPAPVDWADAARTLKGDWSKRGRDVLLRDLTSRQGALVAVAFAIILVVGEPFGSGTRMADLLLLFAGGVPLFGVMRFFDHLRDPAYLRLLDAVFTVVVVAAVALAIRATILASRSDPTALRPKLPVALLVVVAAALLAGNIALALQRPPDDAGWFVNLGAQRLRERGRLPYGDPLTTGTPAAAYGPLMYVAHLPFQVALAPGGVNPSSPPRPALGEQSVYFLPPVRATQWCAIAMHLVGVAALLVIGRRHANLRTALALVVLYCGSLAVLGIGGDLYSVAGITFISHVAPASVTLAAVAALPRPALSGSLLVAAAGLGFYPALFGPLWLGYYWNDHKARWRFLAACFVSAALLCAFVLAFSRPAGEHSRVATVLADTLGHHTDPSGYGRSPFGFWGQRDGWRDAVMRPLVGSVSITSAVWLCLLGYVAYAAVRVRGRSAASLALFSGAVALGFALAKPHATATYLAWYYPLLVVGLCLPRFTSEPQKV